MANPDLLKLRAHDLTDMRVLAACLQDALVPLSDIAYLKREKRFVMVANRFRWEFDKQAADVPDPATVPESDARFEDDAEEPAFERVNCGVCFDRVRGVRTQGLDMQNKDHILNLLTIEANRRSIRLVFSGDILIHLDVGAVACHLEDLSEPWPTRWHPSHQGADEPEPGPAGSGGQA
jgi:hypothetical protein